MRDRIDFLLVVYHNALSVRRHLFAWRFIDISDARGIIVSKVPFLHRDALCDVAEKSTIAVKNDQERSVQNQVRPRITESLPIGICQRNHEGTNTHTNINIDLYE